jgi:hypothetical protein
MNPHDTISKPFETVKRKEDLITEGLQKQIMATRIRPPNLHLVKCCSRCRYARTEGMSVECKRFIANGIASYAICDAYEES